MGTTTLNQLPYPELTDPADVPADIKRLADKLDPLLRPTVVTSLPGAPTDGQEVYYSTGGVLWHLRYDSASAKWKFLGGPPLTSITFSPAATASGTYAPIDGPTVAVPLPGDYLVRLSTNGNGSAVAVTGLAAIKPGTAAANDNNAAIFFATSVGGTVQSVVERTFTLTAAASFDTHYRALGGTGNWPARAMVVTPIRLG